MSKAQETRLERFLEIVPSAVILSAVGAAAYGLLRQGYLRFYSTFATTPEDVGVTQLQMLAGLVRSWPTILGVIALLLLVAGRLPRPDTKPRTWAEGTSSILAVVAILMAILRLWLVPTRFDTAVCNVERGHGIVSSAIPFISVQVFPVDLSWIGDKAEPVTLSSSHTLMYLGHANGRAVLYDYLGGPTTWTVSESDVVIRLHTLATVDKTCERNRWTRWTRGKWIHWLLG